MTINWSAWDWDWMTAWVIFWIVQFFLIEIFGADDGNMVTHHLRPVFHLAPVTWWMTLGVWLWLGPHFLWPAAEDALKRLVNP